MTFITLTEAKKRGLCPTCQGSGKMDNNNNNNNNNKENKNDY